MWILFVFYFILCGQINELLKAAIQSEGVINLFDSSKTK